MQQHCGSRSGSSGSSSSSSSSMCSLEQSADTFYCGFMRLSSRTRPWQAGAFPALILSMIPVGFKCGASSSSMTLATSLPVASSPASFHLL